MCIMIFKLHVVCGYIQSKRLKKSNRTMCRYLPDNRALIGTRQGEASIPNHT